MKQYKVFWILVILALPMGGCVTTTKPRGEEENPSKKTILREKPRSTRTPEVNALTNNRRRAVVFSRTVYYLDGPQQGRPPEGVFKSGTRVTIEVDNGGYIKVSADNGVTAWVSAGSLKPVEE